jgi:hypothetical protein
MTRVRFNCELCVRWTESDGSPYEPVFTVRQILRVKGKNSVLIAFAHSGQVCGLVQ